MSPRSEIIVRCARSWIGTPFVHQQGRKGAGVDCARHIIEVGREAEVLSISEEAWAPFAAYARSPNPRRMRRAMELFLVPIEGPGPGNIAWIQWRDDLPMHLAIVGQLRGRLTMIHADGDVGRCVEHAFSPLWLARVNSWWRYPGDQ